jgi:hypothetical protein
VAGFGSARGVCAILPSAGHDQVYSGGGSGVKSGADLAWTLPLWQVPPAAPGGSDYDLQRVLSWCSRRRSSVVEHVIGNDGVSSSILLGGTSFH